MTMPIFTLHFIPNDNYFTEMMPIDGFAQSLGAASSFDEAADYIRMQMEDDEHFTAAAMTLDNRSIAYFYTNYGVYKIEQINVWFPS